MAGGERMRLLLWWWWMGKNSSIQPKESSPMTFLLHRCPWLTKAISPAIPVYNGLVFLFVLANFSMATFMDPGVFPRGNRKWDWWVPPPFPPFLFSDNLSFYIFNLFMYYLLPSAGSRGDIVVKSFWDFPASELGGVSCPCTRWGWQLRVQRCTASFSFEQLSWLMWFQLPSLCHAGMLDLSRCLHNRKLNVVERRGWTFWNIFIKADFPSKKS